MSNLYKIYKYISFPNNPKDFKQAQRLFHGRGHAYKSFEHITVDYLPPVILITLFSPEARKNIQALSDFLRSKIKSCTSVQVQYRYELSGPIEVIYGDNLTNFDVLENNCRYLISLGKARNTGLFLDMRNGRKWVQDNANNKHVLNLFSYTCGFSVAAIEGRAKLVLNVDMSSPALNVGRQNHRLNNHSLKNVRFEKLNIFKSFGRLKKRGPFDLLICDPPTLQKGSVNIERDYPKIMKRLDEFMAPRSVLMLCLNAPELDEGFIRNNMNQFASNYQFIGFIKAPAVYIDIEEKGLKVLLFERT